MKFLTLHLSSDLRANGPERDSQMWISSSQDLEALRRLFWNVTA